MDNPYLVEVQRALPRLLALFDNDPYRPSRGTGDRLRWAWRYADYANGTHQGAANGLARLVAADVLPPGISAARVLDRIRSMVDATDRLRRTNGSMEESFPLESSFCVTALVAYDLLCAAEVLSERCPDILEDVVKAVAPMIEFLRHEDETHGLISNHLAVAAAALYRWKVLSGEDSGSRGRELLSRILEHQSEEGWFREYDGADPGYQSLCTCFLADLHRMRPDLGLAEPLSRSLGFLWHFVHPDGSFGGTYGSRNTRIFWPAGVEMLAHEIPEAAALAEAMRASVGERRTVTLAAADDVNLVPMFNSYVAAAILEQPALTARSPELPCDRSESTTVDFPEAGLHVRGSGRYYTVVSSSKGGVVAHFDKQEGDSRINGGTYAEDKFGRSYSTQAIQVSPDRDVSPERITVTASLAASCGRLPTPLEFALLRLLSCTLLRLALFRRWFKRRLVRMLLDGGRLLPVRIRREVTWTGGELAIKDEVLQPGGTSVKLRRMEHGRDFISVTMASAGYWQRQDDE